MKNLSIERNPVPLEARKVVKAYPLGHAQTRALDGVDLRIEPGEFVAVMGPSGSGKSSLLNLLVGLDRPTSGEVWVEGRALSTLDEDGLTALRRTRVGVIFQAFNLLPGLSAQENVELPLRAAGTSRQAASQRARAMLERVGLAERCGHRPDELSGGQAQRVAIARALVIEPLIVVADEPTGSLDSENGSGVLRLLRQLNDERGVAVLMVTHAPAAAAYADRIVTMSDGQVVGEERPRADQPVLVHALA